MAPCVKSWQNIWQIWQRLIPNTTRWKGISQREIWNSKTNNYLWVLFRQPAYIFVLHILSSACQTTSMLQFWNTKWESSWDVYFKLSIDSQSVHQKILHHTREAHSALVKNWRYILKNRSHFWTKAMISFTQGMYVMVSPTRVRH